jgi:hypothetical protein
MLFGDLQLQINLRAPLTGGALFCCRSDPAAVTNFPTEESPAYAPFRQARRVSFAAGLA